MWSTYRWVSLAAVLLFAAGGSTGLSAEEAKVRSVAPGAEVRLAVLGSMKSNCTPNPPPDVRVSGEIAEGLVRIAAAKMTTSRFPNCPDAELPVKVVFYKASSTASGSDTVKLEIEEYSGKVREQRYDIRIEEEATR